MCNLKFNLKPNIFGNASHKSKHLLQIPRQDWDANCVRIPIEYTLPVAIKYTVTQHISVHRST